MRWIWIDRFEELVKGTSARAIKNVTLAEDHLHDHFPGFPVMPASLMLEGMAQTGGILLGDLHDFEHVVILAKVPKVTYHSWAVPGDTLVYDAKLLDERDEGGTVEVVASVGERLVAEARSVFVHLDDNDPELGGIDQKNFVFSMNLMGVMEVGRAAAADPETEEAGNA